MVRSKIKTCFSSAPIMISPWNRNLNYLNFEFYRTEKGFGTGSKKQEKTALTSYSEYKIVAILKTYKEISIKIEQGGKLSFFFKYE